MLFMLGYNVNGLGKHLQMSVCHENAKFAGRFDGKGPEKPTSYALPALYPIFVPQ